MTGFPQLELRLTSCRCNYCAIGLQKLDEGRRPHYQTYISKGRIITKGILPQPLAAWIGLVGCLLLIIVSSSVWWDVKGQHQEKGGISTAWQTSVYFLVSSPLSTAHRFLTESAVRKRFFWSSGYFSRHGTGIGRGSGGFLWI